VVDITRAELEYRFKNGKPVEVAEKAYHQARLIEEQGGEYILLAKNGCVTTTLFADREEVVRTRDG
jgi:hypothetical protein